jgi:hypothetical protein
VASDWRLALAPAPILLALLLCPTGAFAEPSASEKETARALMNEGDRKLAQKDLRGALQSYQSADQIMGVPTTGIEVARAQISLGLLVEARDILLRVSRYPKKDGEPASFTAARQQAEDLANQLSRRIATLTLQIPAPVRAPEARLEVKIDESPVAPAAVALPYKINPGKHHIRATAIGYTVAEADLTINEGETRELSLVFRVASGAAPTASAAPPATTAPAPSAAPPATTAAPPATAAPEARPRRPALVWGGFGLGILGVAVGGLGGLVAVSHASSAKSQCTGNQCPESARADIVSAKNWGSVADVAFIVGAVGGGIGLVALLASTGGSSESARWPVEPLIGPGTLGLRGQF